MFAITRQQRVKQLLEKNFNLSLDLQTKLAVNTNTTEIDKLKYSEDKVALSKVGLSFDMLKTTYHNFTTIESLKDLWKLNKPITSEGTVLYVNGYMKIANEIQLLPYINIVDYSSKYLIKNTLSATASIVAKPLLRKAIDAIVTKREINDAKMLFKGTYPDHSLILAKALLEELPEESNVYIDDSSAIPNALLEEVAKITRINLIKSKRK